MSTERRLGKRREVRDGGNRIGNGNRVGNRVGNGVRFGEVVEGEHGCIVLCQFGVSGRRRGTERGVVNDDGG